MNSITTTSLIASSSANNFANTWNIIATILALVGGILIYFLFVKKKGTPNNKFAAWLKRFLSFDTMWIEDLLKIFYIITALSLTLGSFAMIPQGNGMGILYFLLTITFGNVIVRVAYEAILALVMIWRNTTDIKFSVKKEDKKEK